MIISIHFYRLTLSLGGEMQTWISKGPEMTLNLSQSTLDGQVHEALLIRRKLLAVARRITGSATVAEDIVQEVMLQLISAPLGSEVERPASYVTRMVRNLATDYVRRREFERALFVEEPTSGCIAQYGSPEEHVRECQAYQAFRHAMEIMPARTRAFYEQYYFDGVPQKVIAQRAGVSCALVCGLLKDAHRLCVAAIGSNDERKMPVRRRTNA
ncbi:sigma-70 family RNA polymerase sigma factor [Brucella sp. 22210]|uniref:sigma-70 family RNA polymerase sigma factor n=1 Tax=Brucella sp. 22210 TaxID=3453892 RepID=UPI003F864FA3